MFTRVWRFRPAVGAERTFEDLHGPAGPWVTLFRTAPGYLGTELRRLEDGSREYLTIDRWESRAAWEAFRRDCATAYEAIDRDSEDLTESEWLVEEFEDRAS